MVFLVFDELEVLIVVLKKEWVEDCVVVVDVVGFKVVVIDVELFVVLLVFELVEW